MSFPEPREFQVAAHENLRKGVADGHRCQLLMAATGSGKTLISLRLVNEALKKGKRVVFVCDRTTLINQTSATADRYGLPDHGIIQANHWRTDYSKPFQIASAQTLARRKWPDADLIIVDECFPAGTMISAPDGDIAIEKLQVGDKIHNCFGVTQIESVYNATSNKIIKIGLSNGKYVKCTQDHPIFTELGWQPAGVLAVGARVFCKEAVHGLQDYDQPSFKNSQSSRQSNNLLPNGSSVYRNEILLEILLLENKKKTNAQKDFNKAGGVRSLLAKNDGQQSNATRADAIQSKRNIKANRARPQNTGREWQRDDCAAVVDDQFIGLQMDCGIYRENTEKQQGGLSASLQDRYCESDIENCNRAGRVKPQPFKSQRAGQEKRRFAEVIRVESIEIVQSDGLTDVYNLRVADHPSYYANGILVHNCHTQLKAWTEHIPNSRAKVVGLSATPFSAGLGLLFSNLVNASTMAELTKQGVLVPMRVFSCTKPDMQGAATSGGEWTPAAAAERGMAVLGDVVTEWHKYGENRKTIVFGATIAHCESLCAQFVDSGVMAAVFTADTPQSERDELLKEYRKLDSKLKVLISVEALAKGFDVQSVSCIADARPLRKSLSTAIQMWGRGLRSDTENGKTDCILLDFSGNILRFKEDFERIYHEGLDALDMGEKLDKTIRKDDEEKEDKACPSCGYKPFFKNCMACGHKHVAMPEVDVGAGVMHEITIGGKIVAENKRHLWEQCVAYVLGHGNETTRQGRAAHIYKDVTGNWPPRDYMVEFTQPAPISKEVLSRIKAKQIAYAFGKKKEVEMAKLEKSMV